MEFIDTSCIKDSDELIEALKHNVETAQLMRKEIISLKTLDARNVKPINCDEYIKLCEETTDEIDKEEEYKYYAEKILSLDSSNTSLDELENRINEELPSRKNSNYFAIIIYIISKIHANIKFYYDLSLCCTEDLDMLNSIKNSIDFDERKIRYIKNDEFKKSNNEVVSIDNKIIFLENLTRFYPIEELKNIPQEYYDSISELYNSIKNGTFQNVKGLYKRDSLASAISEVKGFKTRILFDKLTPDTYIIISVFIKKCDTNSQYKDFITNRINKYSRVKEEIISELNENDFIEKNNLAKKEFEKILKPSKEKRGSL